MIKKYICAAILSTLCSAVYASDEATATPSNWDVSAELGLNFTSGNTDTSTLKTRIEVTHHLTRWDNNYFIDALRKDDDGEESANKWLISAKGSYKLERENAFLFVEGSREEDKIGVFDNYNSLAIGYGERLYETESIHIDADVGPGYVFFKNNGENQENQNSSILRASAYLNWTISDSATFSQKVMIHRELSDNKNTKTRLESTVTTKINGSLQMKLGLTIVNNSVVPDDRKETDTETSVTLVYTF
jgi:putative salt-induced outer membrane protein